MVHVGVPPGQGCLPKFFTLRYNANQTIIFCFAFNLRFYYFFAREGFTQAACREAGQLGAALLTLQEMEQDL